MVCLSLVSSAPNANNSGGHCKYNSVREVQNFHLGNYNNSTHSSWRWRRCDGYEERGLADIHFHWSRHLNCRQQKKKNCHIFKPTHEVIASVWYFTLNSSVDLCFKSYPNLAFMPYCLVNAGLIPTFFLTLSKLHLYPLFAELYILMFV